MGCIGLGAQAHARELQVLCVVDIYNEGVDVPNVNTLFFFRPTESATVFLQQLGRGLRRAMCSLGEAGDVQPG